MMPIRMTAANRYWTPMSSPRPSLAPRSFPIETRATMITARAPVAPDIMPGRPPATAVIRQTMNAAYSPTIGGTPAIMAKATASGTSARATVSPERRSSLAWILFPNLRYISLNTKISIYCLRCMHACGRCAFKLESGASADLSLNPSYCLILPATPPNLPKDNS